MTKMEKAKTLYATANKAGMANKDIVKKIMKDLKMSEAGARTYAYNARKALGLGKPAKAAKTVKKTVVKAKVDKKTGKLTVTTKAPATNPVVAATERKAANAKLFADFHNEKLAKKA